jgi:hypothetical protein
LNGVETSDRVHIGLVRTPKVICPTELPEPIYADDKLADREVTYRYLADAGNEAQSYLAEDYQTTNELAQADQDAYAELRNGNKAERYLPHRYNTLGHSLSSAGIFSESDMHEGKPEDRRLGLPFESAAARSFCQWSRKLAIRAEPLCIERLTAVGTSVIVHRLLQCSSQKLYL